MPATHRRTVDHLLPLAATCATTLLALLLWGAAFWQLGTTAGAAFTAPTTTGEVTTCPTEPLGPGCTIRYTTPAGVTTTRPVDRPGLLGVTPGDTVPLWLLPDERIQVGGWRPWVDGLVLGALAVAVSSGAVHWFARTLRTGDVRTEFDLWLDEDDVVDRRRRTG